MFTAKNLTSRVGKHGQLFASEPVKLSFLTSGDTSRGRGVTRVVVDDEDDAVVVVVATYF